MAAKTPKKIIKKTTTTPKSTTKKRNKAVKKEENYSIIAGILAGLIILLGGGLLWSNQQSIIEAIDSGNTQIIQQEQEQEDELRIGKEVALAGQIIADDTNTYISSQEYGLVGLENPETFGNPRDGKALIGGTITSFTKGTYFVTINTFEGETPVENSENEEEIVVQTQEIDSTFVAPAGVHFKDLLANNLVVSPDTNKQEIVVRSTKNSHKITINYFLCESGHANYDCIKELNKLKKTNNLLDAYKTPEGTQFYRVKSTNQRYGHVDERYGFFLSADRQAFMNDVFPLMTFVSNAYIDKNIAPKLTDACSDEYTQITSIASRSTLFFDELLSLDIMGRDARNKAIQCLVVIDLNTPLGVSLITVDYLNPEDRPSEPVETPEEQEDTVQEASAEPEETETATNEQTDEQNPTQSGNTASNTLATTDVEQFALKTDNPFVHTFNGDVVFSFPSQNISFGAKNVNLTLGLEGTKCNIQTDVIDYPNSDNLDTEPAISVYTCSTNITAEQAGSYLYIPSNRENKAYFVEVHNPAWNDFAQNLRIQD